VEYQDDALDFTTLFGRDAPVVLEIGFGMLAPGTSVGTLTVGNVRFTPGSIYEFEIDAQGQSDRLIVEQNATLAGTVRVINLRRSSLGTRYTLLDASGAVSGQFDALVLGGDGGVSANALFLTDVLGYSDHDYAVLFSQRYRGRKRIRGLVHDKPPGMNRILHPVIHRFLG